MKNLKIAIVAFTVLFATAFVNSCNKLENDRRGEENSQVTEEVKIPIHLTLGGGSVTKSTKITESDETAIKNVQLFVFDSAGDIESYKSVSDTSELNADVTAGKKNICVFVNAPNLNTVANMSDFDNISSLLTDNSEKSFVMSGRDTCTIVKETTVTIDVKRLVSKVRINKITTAFTSATLAAESFTIDSIYVVNVASDAGYFTDAVPSSWLNQRAWKTSAADPLLAEKISGVVLKNNSSHVQEHDFYVYPNPTDDDNSDLLWSPRHTRLVVQATLKGKTVYYPMTLPILEKNKCYTISELTITRPGSSSPDEPVSIQTCKFKINILDWDTSLSPYTETI